MYIIKYKGKKLSGFYPNDLPVKKYNAKKDKFVYSFNNIITFSNNSYYMFVTKEEAEDFKHYVYRETTRFENFKRYKTVVKDNSLERLGDIVNNLVVVEEQE